MLKNLVIDNIALISHLEIQFDAGLTVLSGETGSGKSIIIDSLAFVLGDRADKSLIKYGEDSAEVTALFEIDSSSPVVGKLIEYGYSYSTEVLLYRKMSVAGKNEIRIQGKPSTLAILKDLSAELVDIFGQGQHLALLDEKNQLAVLDSFCEHGKEADKLKNELYPALTSINRQLRSFGGDEQERERLLDILSYQIKEISDANVSEEEEVELQLAHKRMVNAERLSDSIGEAVGLLDGDGGAISRLAQSVSLLRGISSLESSAEELSERLNSVRLEAEDVSQQLQDMLSSMEFSPAEVDRIEERLEKFRQLKRKYGGSIAEVLQFLENARSKYDDLANASDKIRELNERKGEILSEMYRCALKKSEERRKTAQTLARKIVGELDQLGMRGTNFSVEFNDVPTEEQFGMAPSSDGFDKVRFLMSANVGEPLKPLSKVISGGEMSRFMLAIKNITALAEKIPTMIFDEIDTGISGNMAQMVANKLANVSCGSAGYQCIVITHLPQIAAMADVNLYIKKYERNGKTFTTVEELQDYDQRAEEVSRLMGSIGEHAIVNAKELLDWSAKYKASRK